MHSCPRRKASPRIVDSSCQIFSAQALFDLYEAGRIGFEDALRFADSTNEVRLNIKLHGKESKEKDLTKGIEHLDIV